MILRSIIALAHDLGMDVVAEGAETDFDAVELYQMGCEYAQGFAFGEPMSAQAAGGMLGNEQTRSRALVHILSRESKLRSFPRKRESRVASASRG